MKEKNSLYGDTNIDHMLKCNICYEYAFMKIVWN